jgi:uncharacterized protein YkwD
LNHLLVLWMLYGNYEAPTSVFADRFWFFSPVSFAAKPDVLTGDSAGVTSAAIIHEINLPRQNPTLYATFLDETRQTYAGRVRLRNQKDIRAVDEAMRFLRRARPLPALALSSGLCAAAIGHRGCDGSDPGARISRYGVIAQGWAENIAYGQRSARAIVMALIIDNGVRGRGHRRNIFNRNYNAAGAAYGPHARYGSVCSIDFASGYAEGTFVRAGTDTANSF